MDITELQSKIEKLELDIAVTNSLNAIGACPPPPDSLIEQLMEWKRELKGYYAS